MEADGYLFYWLMWISFIYCYFCLMNRIKSVRICYSILFLLTISNLKIELFGIIIQIILLLLIILGIIFTIRNENVFLNSVKIFVLMLAFTTLNILNVMYSWSLFISSLILISSVVFLLVCFLTEGFRERLILAITGSSLGQLIFDIALVQYSYINEIGSMEFLDFLVVILALIILRKYLSFRLKRLRKKVMILKRNLEQEI